MFKEIRKELCFKGSTLIISTGKIARQADASVLVQMGGSMVLCTCVVSKSSVDNTDFLPFSVYYREMAYAAGKIPGGFFKREGKPSEREVLVSRLIDRPIRPLFDKHFFNETQVICTVLSYDPEFNPDILSIIGASAAIGLSGVPIQSTLGACRVGLIEEKFILNPTNEELKSSKLDLVVAATKSSIMMVESESDFLEEEKMVNAIKFGYESLQPVITVIEELITEAGKPKLESTNLPPIELKEQVLSYVEKDIQKGFAIKSKIERQNVMDSITLNSLEHFVNLGYQNSHIKLILDEIKSDLLKSIIINNGTRIDGRSPETIRDINCEIGFLPNTHGSSLFTRGETQAVVVTTLGSSQDEQVIDGLDGEYKERFMLNYNFPPYSVSEISSLRSPGRREIGHGKLAWKAINKVLPSKSDFAYSIRVVSEITESNGSSSMASVCGASLSLMDAGVPIKCPIAGIAMGLIKFKDNIVILSDILGDEDALGDMDFKVAGSDFGITALQMDIKILGIDIEIISYALKQAKIAKKHILSIMNSTIKSSRNAISKHAPVITTFKINKDKIREIIGPGGKVIKEICESTKAKIDISDDGTVIISCANNDKLLEVKNRIEEITFEPNIGDIFTGKIVKLLDSGIFVNYAHQKDGFVHISEISHDRVDIISAVVSEGDIVKVKILGFDNRGKAKLTIKNVNTTFENQKDVNKVIKKGNKFSNKKRDYKNNNNNKIFTEKKYF